MTDRCAAVEGGGGLFLIGQHPGLFPSFLPDSPKLPALLARGPGGQTDRLRSKEAQCVCGCVGLVERVSEPRTCLANEVIMTPDSLIG